MSGQSTPGAHAAPFPPPRQFVQVVEAESVEIQADFGNRTCGIATETPQQRTVETLTDVKGFSERATETDVVGRWDVAVQNSTSMCDVAIDVGEWNYKMVSSVDAQTDAPDLTDSLFWCSQSSMEMIPFLNDILDRIDQDTLNTDASETISKDKRDNLQLRADNIMLRIEVAELKR